MTNDPELKEWAADWQAGSDQESSAEAIRLYAQGRNRFMWTWVLFELSVGAMALPVLGYLGWTAPDAVQRWAMWLLAFITIAAMSVGWWNWRGSLVASARTTAEYLAVSAERLRRMRQAWRIGWIVLIAQVVVFSVWIGTRSFAAAAAERFAWGWLLFVTLTAVAFMRWLDRRIRRDADTFEALKRELL
jgi:hypothetical protein